MTNFQKNKETNGKTTIYHYNETGSLLNIMRLVTFDLLHLWVIVFWGCHGRRHGRLFVVHWAEF